MNDTHSADECITAARELKLSLLDERDALASNDATRLEAAVHAKTARLRTFANALRTQEESSLQPQHQRRTGDRTERVAADSTWREFATLAAECERLNTSNGAAIRLRQQQIGTRIALLRGDDTEPNIYGPQGAADNTAGSRPLLEA